MMYVTHLRWWLSACVSTKYVNPGTIKLIGPLLTCRLIALE